MSLKGGQRRLKVGRHLLADPQTGRFVQLVGPSRAPKSRPGLLKSRKKKYEK